jgi:hypothetical protein
MKFSLINNNRIKTNGVILLSLKSLDYICFLHKYFNKSQDFPKINIFSYSFLPFLIV